jgi:hypothetical protein
MSVKINGEEFSIFEYDTLDTIKYRYSIQQNIIPSYVEFKIEKEFNIQTTQENINNVSISYISETDYKVNFYEDTVISSINVNQIIDEVEVDTSEEKVFNNSIDKIDSIIKKKMKLQLTKLDIVYLYMIKEYSVFETETYIDSYNFVREDSTLFGLNTYLDKNSSEQNYKVFYDKFKNEYVLISKNVSQQETTFSKFETLTNYNIDKIPKSFVSDIKETQLKYDGEFELTVDIYELLNKMTPSRELPFLKISKFYKILNYFISPIVWLEPEDEDTESLRLYILKTKEESEVNLASPKADNYVVIKIDQTSEEKDVFKYKYSIISEGGELVIDEELILTTLFKHLPESPKQMTLRKTFGKGYFIIKGIEIPREILYDFALNDDIVSSMITINESFKIEKIKGGIRFLLFNTISCSMIMKTIEKPSEEEIETFQGKLDVGDQIIRIDIRKAKSKIFLSHSIKTFIQSLIYMIKNKDIEFYDFYDQYIPDIRKRIAKRKKIITESKDLKDIFPEIYPSGYGRFCNFQPLAILSKEDAEDEMKKGNDVMLFPLTPSEGRQAYYVCNNPSYPYVGYKQSNLPNSDKFGILPCCYQTDQTVPGMFRHSYENNIIDIKAQSLIEKEDDDSKKKIDIIIKTQRILKKDRYGFLPPNILTLLNTVQTETLLGNKRFIRKGVEQSINSSIEALIESLNLDISVKDIRKQIRKMATYNLGTQNMLFYNNIVKILDNNENIDPLIFLNILENMFQVNIIVFCRDKVNNTLGTFCTPIFKKYMIINDKTKLFNKTVLLFRTFGSEVNKLTYPQTEYIVLETNIKNIDKVQGDIQKTFKTSDEFITKLMSLYKSTINIHINNIKFNNKLVSQIEDSNGKIRHVKLKIDNDDIIVYTSPLSAFGFKSFDKDNVQYDNKISLDKYSPKIIQKFFETEEIINVEKVLFTNFDNQSILIGYYFEKDDVKGFIYSNDYTNSNNITSVVYDLKRHEYIAPLGVGVTLLKQYNEYIKLANMLTSYVLYLFSKEYSEKINDILKLNNNDDFNNSLKEYIKKFENNIIVKEDHKYDSSKRLLSLKNESFIKRNSLIVSSEEMKKRMLYSLYSICKTDLYSVFTYKSKKYVPNFYTTSKDFDQSEHYTIYYTKKELAIYNIDPTLTYKSFSIPPVFGDNSFFFSNQDVMDGHTFLAQKVPTIENGIFTSNFFNKYRINPTDRDSEISLDQANLTLFIYNGVETITEEIVVNEALEMVYIFLLKQEDKVYFYVLLNY